MKPAGSQSIRLIRRLDGVAILFEDGNEPKPVKVVLARPITAPEGEVAFLDETKKEVAMVAGLVLLDPESRAIAGEELQKRYLTARIDRVHRAWAQLGARYFDVATHLGRRTFVIKSINRHVTWLTDDHILFRDTMGNRYEIPSLKQLDARSIAQLENVI